MPADTILHKAAHSGDLNQVKKIVEEGKIDINAPGASDRRPLHRAAASDNIPMCTYLVTNGAIVDQEDRTGRTPLHWACISGAATSTNYLVNEVKANIFAQASDGNSPLHLASECGHVDLVNVIVTSAGPKKTELFDLKTSEGKTAGELAKIEKKKDVSKALKAAGDKTAGGSSVCIIS